jgi:hypothetical protein
MSVGSEYLENKFAIAWTERVEGLLFNALPQLSGRFGQTRFELFNSFAQNGVEVLLPADTATEIHRSGESQAAKDAYRRPSWFVHPG